MAPKPNIIDATLERHKVPIWIKPYIYKYVKNNPVEAVKRVTSFIEVKRKKGEVNGKYIKLPNGMTFKISVIIHILNLFYYEENILADIKREWAVGFIDGNHPDYRSHFASMSDLNAKRMSAVKNLIEGLNYKVGEPSKEVVDVFEYVRNIRDPCERIIALNVILMDAYAKPFGYIFYKVFYRAAPEFMRSFGKAFRSTEPENLWGIEESRRIIKQGLVDNDHLIALAEGILSRTCRSVDAEMAIARDSKIETEAKLLRDISIAYPLHHLSDMGVRIDIETEINKIIKLSESHVK